jgi:hypothetical protein
MVNYKNICDEIVKAVRETGSFIQHESARFDIGMTESKGLNDFVSYVDKGSEKMLVERLGNILPEAGFITEEGTSTKKGYRYSWVIDPLDGTTNFLHGLHPYSISVALMEQDEMKHSRHGKTEVHGSTIIRYTYPQLLLLQTALLQQVSHTMILTALTNSWKAFYISVRLHMESGDWVLHQSIWHMSPAAGLKPSMNTLFIHGMLRQVSCLSEKPEDS